jgi:NTP pyrophosphatase (non-canonical NTP hydrolase)
MTFDEYQKQALTTAILSGDELKDLMHWILGINGEAGEIAEKIKKIIRDKNAVLTSDDKEELIKEIGDVLWYLAVLTKHLGYDFDEVGKRNIAKLADRKKRDVIKGKGDNR